MRLLSWNINGIRTLPQYHPWNSVKGTAGILDHLAADIVCFQEMKSSRAALTQDIALPGTAEVAHPGKYDSFFSFPLSKGGYSGVGVYTSSISAVPLKAEEGLAGILHPTNNGVKQPLTPEERISPSYPYAHELNLMLDPPSNETPPVDFALLEAEGRAVTLDFGLFVLVNTYCPNEGSEKRLPFKMNYHRLLEARVRKLVEEEGRDVIVVGDINICSKLIDHCDGHLASHAAGFHDHPAREWFESWLTPKGPMTDVIRSFWPDRKGMYTCWNTKISARESNYGTRIDYVLITKGLIPWIKHGDIQPDLKGSDHCPVFVDFHDEITLPSGEKQVLKEMMHMQGEGRRDPPRMAARFWDEFSGRQTRLSAFFGKKGEPPSRSGSATVPPAVKPTHSIPTITAYRPLTKAILVEDVDSDLEIIEPPKVANTPGKALSSTATKRKEAPNSGWSKEKGPGASKSQPSAAKKQKQTAGQTSLSNFFAKPKPEPKGEGTASRYTPKADVQDLEADYQYALSLSQETAHVPSLSQPGTTGSQGSGPGAWGKLLAPIKAPCCVIHGEPTKEHTVGKPGPNKGKTFFICSRAVGPGYDKGRGERLRTEVDHRYRCDFFKWSSDVKRASLKDSKEGGGA